VEAQKTGRGDTGVENHFLGADGTRAKKEKRALAELVKGFAVRTLITKP